MPPFDDAPHVPVATAAQVFARLGSFASSLSWSLHVPGTHSGSSLTYDALLNILADKGRDFRDDTRSLRAHVRQVLLRTLGSLRRMPTRYELERTARDAILGWIVGRMDRRVNDVRIAANDAAYRAWKVHHGFDSRPGQRTQELRNAVVSDGQVEIT